MRAPVADRLRVRQRVLRHDRIAADERVLADAAELMDAGERADRGEVVDRTCPPSVAALPKIVSLPIWQSWATCTYTMNRLRSPISVSPPPPRVPRWIVTNSRKMFVPADHERAFPRRDTSGPAASGRWTRTERSGCRRRSRSTRRSRRRRQSWQCFPIRTCGPTTAYGPTTVPSPISAVGCTIARGSIVGHPPSAPTGVGLGHDLVAE